MDIVLYQCQTSLMVGITLPSEHAPAPAPLPDSTVVLQAIVSDNSNDFTITPDDVRNSDWYNVYGQRMEKYSWPVELQYLYGQLQCWEVERRLSGDDVAYAWYLMSLDNVDSIQYNYGKCEEYTGCSVDFAHAYLGMGHAWVASWCPDTQNIYYRHDGGSNGWEQSHNGEMACRFVPAEEQRRPLSDWFRILTTSREEDQFGRPLDAPFARPPKELEDRCWNIVKERNGITY